MHHTDARNPVLHFETPQCPMQCEKLWFYNIDEYILKNYFKLYKGKLLPYQMQGMVNLSFDLSS